MQKNKLREIKEIFLVLRIVVSLNKCLVLLNIKYIASNTPDSAHE